MLSIKQVLIEGKAILSEQESPALEAEVLLTSVLNKSREYLFTWPEETIEQAQYKQYLLHCQRRHKGHPIAYLTGFRSFWKMEFKVNFHVLIPRPETELLIELALEKSIGDTVQKVADLGTGSGAIALSLAMERPQWEITATDISAEALVVARENGKIAGVNNVSFHQGNWCEVLNEEDFDMIVSNPPYIDEHDGHLDQGDLRFEPAQALISMEQGLADIKEIAECARARLKPEGWLMLEHGYQQSVSVQHILTGFGYKEINTIVDLAGNDRVTMARRQLD